MRIGVDRKSHAVVDSRTDRLRSGIQSVESSVDLNRRAGRGGGLHHGVEVELDSRPAPDIATRQVADDVDGGVSHGLQHPLGLLILV